MAVKRCNLLRVESLLHFIGAEILGTKMEFLAKYDQNVPSGVMVSEPRVYIQVEYTSKCSKTKESKIWRGRKFYMSRHMTDDEIVKTAYVALKMAVEHEIMEGFTFDNKLVFNPHTPFTELIAISHKEVTRADENSPVKVLGSGKIKKALNGGNFLTPLHLKLNNISKEDVDKFCVLNNITYRVSSRVGLYFLDAKDEMITDFQTMDEDE